MTLQQADIDYFNLGQAENPRYWGRFGGGKPDFNGAVVVDFGCGHGSLCVDIAQSGAKRVLGLDLNARLIDFANENLKRNYPQFADTIEFRLQDLRETPEVGIDYFVSKDTFEHVLELEQVLAEMKKRLKPRGYVYTGFSPLWNSPFGGHGLTKRQLPWGHILLSERFLVKRHNRSHSKKATSIRDLGLNTVSLVEHRRILRSCGMEIVFLKVNAGERPLLRLFSLIRHVPFLDEYFSHNLYCILQK